MANQMNTQQNDGGTVTIERPQTAPPRLDRMPMWRVLLHNDDRNEMLDVVRTVTELTALQREEAFHRTLEAHQRGIALLVSTHREHAELLQEQFQSKRLTVTIEPE